MPRSRDHAVARRQPIHVALFGFVALAQAGSPGEERRKVPNEAPRRGHEQDSPAWLRRRALRVREMANYLPPGDEAVARLNEYAAELEARAKAIDDGHAVSMHG